jgi:hypothetical protein
LYSLPDLGRIKTEDHGLRRLRLGRPILAHSVWQTYPRVSCNIKNNLQPRLFP